MDEYEQIKEDTKFIRLLIHLKECEIITERGFYDLLYPTSEAIEEAKEYL